MAVVDPLLPALAELTGPGARSIVDAVVRAGGGVLGTCRRHQVLYYPGRRATVWFVTSVSWGGAAPVEESIVAMVGVGGPPDGTLVVEAGDLQVGLFRYPADPMLPGLAAAVTPDRAGALLPEHPSSAPIGDLALAVRSYRPGRRAVVQATIPAAGDAPASSVFLKVVPPAELPGLASRIELLSDVLPVPRILAVREEVGALVLEALPGRTIRDVLLDGRPGDVAALPSGDDLIALLDRMPAPTGPVRTRVRPIVRAAEHGSVLAAVLPVEEARISDILARIGPATAVGAPVLVHGDLHDGQLTTEHGPIAGILDLDGATTGYRVDDLANMVAHLVALAAAMPRRRPAIDQWRRRLQGPFERAVGADELHRHVAAVLVGLAAGPFRAQEHRWQRRVRARLADAATWAEGRGDRDVAA